LELLDELQFSILMQAVQQSSYSSFVKVLNETVTDINFENNRGQTALHLLFEGTAADTSSKLQALVEKKADISAADCKGRTCLSAMLVSKAPIEVKREAYELFPQNTAKFRSCLRSIDKDGFSALSLATSISDVQLMNAVLDAYKLHFPLIKPKHYLNYPEYLQHCAGDHGDILVPYRTWAMTNAPHTAVKPLETALIAQQADIVAVLMTSGASLNVFSKMNEPLLTTLLSTGNSDLIALTLQSIPSTSLLHPFFKVSANGHFKSSCLSPQPDLTCEVLTIFGRVHELKAEAVKVLVNWLLESGPYAKAYPKLFVPQRQTLTAAHRVNVLREVITADNASLLLALLPAALDESAFDCLYAQAFDLSIALSRPNCFKAVFTLRSMQILQDPVKHIAPEVVKTLEMYQTARIQIEGVQIPQFYDYSFLIFSLRAELPSLEIIQTLINAGADRHCASAILNMEVCLFYELFRFNRSRQLPGKSVGKALNELNSTLPPIVEFLLDWLLDKAKGEQRYYRQVLAAVEVCSSLGGFKVFMARSCWHIYPFIRQGYWPVLQRILYDLEAPLFGKCLKLPEDNKLFAKNTSKLIKNLSLARHFDLLNELLAQMQRHVALMLPEEPLVFHEISEDTAIWELEDPSGERSEELPSSNEFQSVEEDSDDDFIVFSDSSFTEETKS
jgi:hypothetical protein